MSLVTDLRPGPVDGGRVEEGVHQEGAEDDQQRS